MPFAPVAGPAYIRRRLGQGESARSSYCCLQLNCDFLARRAEYLREPGVEPEPGSRRLETGFRRQPGIQLLIWR
jgi:hypothetical protein